MTSMATGTRRNLNVLSDRASSEGTLFFLLGLVLIPIPYNYLSRIPSQLFHCLRGRVSLIQNLLYNQKQSIPSSFPLIQRPNGMRNVVTCIQMRQL